ncbi:hypothetical protein D3C84_840800 [compost metagenome]
MIEAFDGQLVRQALGGKQHVDRNQPFLDLGTRSAERGNVDRVDAVDRVTDEGTFAPAHDLFTGTNGPWQVGDGIVVIDEGVEDLRTGRLGTLFAIVIADRLERPVFVLELEVVPVLAADEHAGIAVLQFKVVNALEDLREGLALLEILPPVITGRRLPATAIDRAHQGIVCIAHAPTRADRQRRVERAFDFPDVE